MKVRDDAREKAATLEELRLRGQIESLRQQQKDSRRNFVASLCADWAGARPGIQRVASLFDRRGQGR